MKKTGIHYNKKITMKRTVIIFCFVFSFIPLVQSCRQAEGDYPGDEYTFDMIESKAYETYALNPLLEDSMGAMLPVKGTVPYTGDAISGNYNAADGEINLPYQYQNTTEDYERAGLELVNPLPANSENIAAGQHYFDIYCAICHGMEGDGKGTIVSNGKYTAAPPSYFADGYIDMPDGKMFHSMTYGKGAMQSYAYALSKKERWEVITYINSLQQTYLAKNNITISANVQDSVKVK